MDEMLTVLVKVQFPIHWYFAEIMWVAFANVKATHIFFSKTISVHAIFNDQNLNDTLTNNIFSFEQMGPDIYQRKKVLRFHANGHQNKDEFNEM